MGGGTWLDGVRGQEGELWYLARWGLTGNRGYCGAWLVEFRGIIGVIGYLARGVIWDTEGVIMGVHEWGYS